MRLISGTMQPTPIAMLPIVAGIPPADIRRDHLVLKLAEKADDLSSLVPSLPADAPLQRIRRHHFATRAEKLRSCSPLSPSWVEDRWTEEWERSNTALHEFVTKPSQKPTGHHLDRQPWVRLNRLRTGWGKTHSFLHMIGSPDDDKCPCGAPQTVRHLLQECPLFMPPNGRNGLVHLDDETVEWLRDVPV